MRWLQVIFNDYYHFLILASHLYSNKRESNLDDEEDAVAAGNCNDHYRCRYHPLVLVGFILVS